MRTSKQGLAFLERHEGVVLKAYRDAVGVLTIGAGLTAASGVVVPKPGMKITRGEATELLNRALRRNYEPAVARAMPGAKQHEYDGGVSFHFNTGAVSRASWVKAWLAKDWRQVRDKIMLWRKGGGRVLPGLERRRAEEFELIRTGAYSTGGISGPVPGWALELVPIDEPTRAAIHKALKGLGYEAGSPNGLFPEGGIKAFQRDHDLTVDGKIGKATLSTLQRRVDASSKAKAGGAAGAAGGAGTQAGSATDNLPDILAQGWVGWAVLGLAALYLAYLAWAYRDVVAAKIQSFLPGLAAKLRSF